MIISAGRDIGNGVILHQSYNESAREIKGVAIIDTPPISVNSVLVTVTPFVPIKSAAMEGNNAGTEESWTKPICNYYGRMLIIDDGMYDCPQNPTYPRSARNLYRPPFPVG